jgi:CDP-diacylglycerol--glycerol-3-phosphate 3-phosphatidyltransferase
MQFNIPTLLTLFRVILIPFFVLAFYLPFTWAPFACALIFFVAAVTDWFDGYLARRWNQSTRFGAFSIRLPIKLWLLLPWCWLPSIIIPGG